jgi:tetratricopeptide (TPR) repeat protein
MKHRKSLSILVLAAVLLAGCTIPKTVEAPREVTGKENLAALHQAERVYHDGDYQSARRQFEQLAQRYPRNPYIWLRLGNACAKVMQYDDAAFAYQHALAEDKQYVQASYNLGLVRLAQSEQAFDQAKAVAPEGSAMAHEVDDVFQYSRRLMLLLSNGSTAAAAIPSREAGTALAAGEGSVK